MRFEDVAFLKSWALMNMYVLVTDIGGGERGLLNENAVLSALEAPQTGYYRSLGEMAAVYVYGFVNNHGFVDGNKRTAAAVLMTFLGANGYPVELGDEWIDIIVQVADGGVTRARLTHLIVTTLMGGIDVPIEFDDIP